MRYLFPFAVLILAGCHSWYLVESEYRQVTIEPEPEVASAPAYGEVVRPGISVALSAPDACADQTSSEATGGAEPAGELLSTTCGVEMSELERALVRAGFRVVSWSAIRQMVDLEGEERVTALDAARALNAVVLVQVNSLERSLSRPARDSEWERTFYEWEISPIDWFFGVGTRGVKGGRAEVPEARARALEWGIARVEDAKAPRSRLSATINATAILAETGEAFWFYRWTHSQKAVVDGPAVELFECHRSILSRCVQQTMPTRPRAVAGSARRGGGGGRSSRPREYARPADAAYFRLVLEVVDDLASRFAGRRTSE